MTTPLPPPHQQSPWQPSPEGRTAPGAQPVYDQYQRTTNGMALAAIIATAFTLVSGVGWILGLIFGHIALHQLKRQPEPKQKGRGLALASVIIGWIIAALFMLMIGLILAVVVGASSSAGTANEVSSPAPTVTEATPPVTEATPPVTEAPVAEATPTTLPPTTTAASPTDDGLDALTGQPNVAGFVGPFTVADGTRVAVLTRSGPEDEGGTVELAVGRPDGWVIEHTDPVGIVIAAPVEIGDVTGDGVPEIKVQNFGLLGGMSYDILYRIDADGPHLVRFPFDTDALTAMGIEYHDSERIDSATLDHVESTFTMFTNSFEEIYEQHVTWWLDRSGEWTLRPNLPVEGDVTACSLYSYEDTLPLHLGDEGFGVRYVQVELSNRGYDVSVDDIFGPGTRDAVLAFQRDNGLPAFGTVGFDTWRALGGGQELPAIANLGGGDMNDDGMITPDELGE